MSLDNNLLEKVYRKVLLARMCEQQIMSEYFNDEMKTPVHLGIGAEAIACGVHQALPSDTHYFGTYRNHSLFLSASEDFDGFFGEMYGKAHGCAKGKAGSMHMSCPEYGLIATSAVVGTTIPIAVGAALAAQYTNNPRIVVTFFGDGAVEEGAFYESMNFASLKKLPVLFVCEDNDLAIHSCRAEREGFRGFKELVSAFHCEFDSGDGTDAVDVVRKTQSMFGRMKKSGRPGFLHFNYFRYLEHVGPLGDFDKGYRNKPLDIDETHDPLPILERYLDAAGISKDWRSQLREEFQGKIQQSVRKAKQAPYPHESELLTDVFSHTNGAH